MKWYYFLIWLLILVVLFIWWIIWLGFYLSPQDPIEASDVIVVVSGGETQARAREGIKLYSAGYSPKIIFSGAARDQDQTGISNAKSMAKIATTADVPNGAIILEESSKTSIITIG